MDMLVLEKILNILWVAFLIICYIGCIIICIVNILNNSTDAIGITSIILLVMIVGFIAVYLKYRIF